MAESSDRQQAVALVRKLREDLAQARSRVDALESDNARLTGELEASRAETEEMKAKYERLKLARAYGWDEESKAGATKRISAIMREIDCCLALLRRID